MPLSLVNRFCTSIDRQWHLIQAGWQIGEHSDYDYPIGEELSSFGTLNVVRMKWNVNVEKYVKPNEGSRIVEWQLKQREEISQIDYDKFIFISNPS